MYQLQPTFGDDTIYHRACALSFLPSELVHADCHIFPLFALVGSESDTSFRNMLEYSGMVQLFFDLAFIWNFSRILAYCAN